MERKLVKQGRNALTVTLPAKWLQAKGLQAGDVVQVEEGNKELRVSVGSRAKRKEVTLSVKDLDKGLIWNLVLGRYIEGYDNITVHHNSPAVLQEIGQELLGMMIEEHSNERSVLKSIIFVPENNFEALFRNATYMFLHQVKMLAGISAGNVKLEEVKKQERMIDKNVYYCLRYLNKYHDQEQAYRYFLLCSTLESAADQVSQIAKFLGKEKRLAKDFICVVELYLKYLFSHDLGKLSASLREFRKRLNKKSFVDGLAFTLIEILHNNLGYLISENNKI